MVKSDLDTQIHVPTLTDDSDALTTASIFTIISFFCRRLTMSEQNPDIIDVVDTTNKTTFEHEDNQERKVG